MLFHFLNLLVIFKHLQNALHNRFYPTMHSATPLKRRSSISCLKGYDYVRGQCCEIVSEVSMSSLNIEMTSLLGAQIGQDNRLQNFN